MIKNKDRNINASKLTSEEMEWEKEWDKLHPNMVGLAVEKTEKDFIRKQLDLQEKRDMEWVLKEVFRYPNPEEVDGDEDYEDIRDWIDLQRAELRSKLSSKKV